MAYIDKIVVNGQEVDSAKPTYYHPINIISTDMSTNPKVLIAFSIINNDSTEYTSLSQVVALIRSWNLYEATILASGTVVNADGDVIPVHSYTVLQDNEYYDGFDNTGAYKFGSLLNMAGLSLKDNVNRIH